MRFLHRDEIELSRAPLSRPGHEVNASPKLDWFAVEFDRADPSLLLLDQLSLPSVERYVRLRTPDEVAGAIRNMLVRGAPAIGMSAAYALALQALLERGDAGTFLVANGIASKALAATRPTAVNLAWAIARMSRKAADVATLGPVERYEAMLLEAEAIHREDVAACFAMGELGAADVPQGATILTHCNAGALATGGYGTALGVIRAAAAAGKVKCVLADETRPYLQGARLTAWELQRDGIPVEVITDNMAAHYFQKGEIDFVTVGSDRIAKNGDVANKIGTYGVAVLADAHDVPFTVAAPWSTVDLSFETGAAIPIEQRGREEVAKIGERVLVPDGVPCRHPAFDVTPARLVKCVYTERGVVHPAAGQSMSELISGASK